MMYQLGVIHIIQILDFEVTLCDTYTLFTQHDLTGFFINFKVIPLQTFCECIRLQVQVCCFFRATGNDQRAVLHIGNHIITQIIKAQLGVCGICNITVKCITLLRWCQRAGVYTDTQTQEPVNLSHPFRITACQIVVDSNNVYPLAA